MEVVLIVLAIAVVALIAWALLKKRRDGRREEARELRQDARTHGLQAEREEAEAQERAARAKREAAAAELQAARAENVRAEATEREERAAKVDPDSDYDDDAEREDARTR
jgi:hypothetical protein